MRTPRGVALRWLPPLAAAAVVAGVVAVPAAFASSPRATVAPKSLEAVDTDLLLEQDVSHSGTIRATADLGLPDLPTASLGGLGTVTTLLTGTHTLRYWQSGASRQRLAVLDTLAETDLVRVGSALGSYDSHQNAATRLTVPRVTAEGSTSSAGQGFSQILTGLVTPGTNTDVRFGLPASIAGRNAYTLDLIPRQSGTLVDHVDVAIDADRGTILRIRIYAKGYASPAFEATYTAIAFRTPPASLFDLIARLPAAPAKLPATVTVPTAQPSRAPELTTTGSGWATIVHLPLGRLGGSLGSSLDRLTEPVAQGRLLQTRLLSALITPNDGVWIGAVPSNALIAAARG